MTTLYLDFAGGNDANTGASFAQRWKTFTSGATAARIAPGDTIRVKASPDETSLSINATWTQDSKTVTLASSLTQLIDDGEAAWTASANVTSTADTVLFKEGTKSAKHVFAGAFATGLGSFKATGTLDLSAYQQVSFWILTTVGFPANALSIRLCSDVAGLTTVDTIVVPAMPAANNWTAFTVDTGGALGSSIKSVALYWDQDPSAVTIQIDDIIACKASSTADCLSLTSLIGKVHNLCWVASTTYATNDIRKPTQPNRNGFRYKVTAGGGGAAGGSEPTWPLEIGTTVVDGALTWTCEGLEDSWYPIQSVNGTTVKIDNICSTLGSAGRGYSGDTETVAAYKREPILFAMVSANGTVHQGTTEGGTSASPTTFSGGWNTTDMSTQTGETWVSGQNGLGIAYSCGFAYTTLTNLNATRVFTGFSIGAGPAVKILNCHVIGGVVGINLLTTGAYDASIIGAHVANGVASNPTGLLDCSAVSNTLIRRVSAHGNPGNTLVGSGITTGDDCIIDVVYCYNNVIGLLTQVGRGVNHLVTRSNTVAAINTTGSGGSLIRIRYSNLQESPAFGSAGSQIRLQQGGQDRLYSQDNGQVLGAHLITWLDANLSTISSATDQRHTASGIAWKFNPKHSIRSVELPLFLSISRIKVTGGALATFSIWTRRDSTQIQGSMVVAGGQIAGVPVDVSVSCVPSINTWTQYSLTFTPTNTGVVEVKFLVWDGTGTTNSFWIDDLNATQ